MSFSLRQFLDIELHSFHLAGIIQTIGISVQKHEVLFPLLPTLGLILILPPGIAQHIGLPPEPATSSPTRPLLGLLLGRRIEQALNILLRHHIDSAFGTAVGHVFVDDFQHGGDVSRQEFLFLAVAPRWSWVAGEACNSWGLAAVIR
jgi:hypothetical protein